MMTPEQQALAVRRYIDTVLSGQVANLTTPQIEAIVAGLAGDPDHVPAIELRNGQLDEIKAVIAEVLAPPPEPAPVRQVAPRDFLHRFTIPERLAILRSNNDNALIAWSELSTVRDDVEFDHEETIQLLGALVQAGLIAESRIAELLEDA